MRDNLDKDFEYEYGMSVEEAKREFARKCEIEDGGPKENQKEQ